KKAVDVVGKDYIPYKDGVFFTASKKAEFWVGAWKKEGFNPICSYARSEEDARNGDELAAKYPLFSVQRKTYRSVHSTFNNLEWMDEVCDRKPVVLLNEADAEARGIADGNAVVVFNDRGEHRGVAGVNDRIKAGVVGLQAAGGVWGVVELRLATVGALGGTTAQPDPRRREEGGVSHGARILDEQQELLRMQDMLHRLQEREAA
ncbi:MAG: molybdopterin dinucleotide binding domain-containing protein, partial [Eggerthellaceae bacterium]